MSVENKRVESQIRERAYAQVETGMDYADINEAVKLYLDFCQEPDSYTGQIAYEHENGKRGSQVGHVIKGGEGQDRKRYLHYRDGLPDWLMASGVEITPQLDRFLEAAEAIHERACSTMRENMVELDGKYPGLVGMHFPEHGDRDFYTRFLVYHPTKTGQLARAHYDLSTMTLAMAESAPGLRLGGDSYNLQPVQHREGEGKLFLGGGWRNVYPDSDLPLGWHDVIQADQETVNEDVVRWAVVMFANPEHDTQPDENEAHTVAA